MVWSKGLGVESFEVNESRCIKTQLSEGLELESGSEMS